MPSIPFTLLLATAHAHRRAAFEARAQDRSRRCAPTRAFRAAPPAESPARAAESHQEPAARGRGRGLRPRDRQNLRGARRPWREETVAGTPSRARSPRCFKTSSRSCHARARGTRAGAPRSRNVVTDFARVRVEAARGPLPDAGMPGARLARAARIRAAPAMRLRAPHRGVGVLRPDAEESRRCERLRNAAHAGAARRRHTDGARADRTWPRSPPSCRSPGQESPCTIISSAGRAGSCFDAPREGLSCTTPASMGAPCSIAARSLRRWCPMAMPATAGAGARRSTRASTDWKAREPARDGHRRVDQRRALRR